MTAGNFIVLLGGLALFLYGVTLMSDGMKLVAGGRFESFINKITGSPIKALGFGTGLAAVIQSSSATSIMAMGFVDTRLIKMRQAFYIVLGSILGTSVTSWLLLLTNTELSKGSVSIFSTAVITGIIAVIGIILRKFSRSQSHHNTGNILLGFAVLLMGMSTITSALEPLNDSEAFMTGFTRLSNPFLGIIIGIAFTCIVQSSALAVATIQAIALTGALTFEVAFPLLLGITIGGALPVLISAIGVSVNGKCTALSHLVFDVSGVVVIGAVFYIINAVHPFAFMSSYISILNVTVLNTVLRLAIVIILSPFVGKIEKFTCLIIKDQATRRDPQFEMLEERFLDHTAVAIAQSRRTINNMAVTVKKNIDDAFTALANYSDEIFQEVVDTEAVVDQYEDYLGSYIIKINDKQLSKKQNEEIYKFLHAITDLERISDHAMNLGENAKEIHEKKYEFSPEARRELSILQSAVSEIVDITINAFVNDDLEEARKVEPLEEVVDELCDQLKHNHIDRLQNDTCTLSHGFVFNDLLTNYERIGDHCSNIAVAMIETNNDSFETHQYIDIMINIKDKNFEDYFDEFKKKYRI